jgi:hypothetical protein
MRHKLGVLLAIAFAGLGQPGGAFGQANQPASASVIALPYPYELGSTFEVTKVDPGGTAQIVAVGPSPESWWAKAGLIRPRGAERPEPSLTEGDYLMLVRRLVDSGEPRLFRVGVRVVGAKESTVQLGKTGAAKVRTGDRCSMIRPQNVTAAQLRALPQVIPFTAETEKNMSRTATLQARTLANLSRIGLALYEFQEAHSFWPPAFLVGPDGKPWHSWRVLLLPYLGHRDLFDRYDFSQPWDSAKNLWLLDRMPAVFHDPIYGEELGHFTHYAALVGGGAGSKFAGSSWPLRTGAPVSAMRMKDVTILPLGRLSEGDVSKRPNRDLSIRTLPILKFERTNTPFIHAQWDTNRTYNTIVVAAVSPERKIPWTKPEDITVGPEFPLRLGQPGGIAAPYPFGNAATIHRAAPVLFADGASSALLDTIDPSTLYALLTLESSDFIDWRKVPEARFAIYSSPHSPKLLIDCERGRATITEPTLIEAGAPPRASRLTPRPEPKQSRPRAPSAIELPYPYELGWTYEVTKVDPGGTAQIVAVGPSPESEWARAEAPAVSQALFWPPKDIVPEPSVLGGPCLMLVKPLVGGGEPRLFRVEVNVVGVMESTVRLGKAGAAKVQVGDRCSLIRPLALTPGQVLELKHRFGLAASPDIWIRAFGRSEPTLTQDELRAFPQVIPITAARKEKPKARESLQQARTLSNLSAIGRAMKRFDEIHHFSPPAFLVGPDGKPWHSWRVLLLPYLGHRDLFDRYDFSQPWDSAKNLRLLDKMPAAFHDPIYGEELGHFTHYAALVGDGPGLRLTGSRPTLQAAFSPAGLSMNDATIEPLLRLSELDVSTGPNGELSVSPPWFLRFSDWQPPKGSISISDFTDGISTTIVVAAVSPDRKIPWTKPEDIAVGPEFPLQLGQPGGIAAPYSTGRAPNLHRAAPVLFADGTSSAISSTPSIRRPSAPSSPGPAARASTDCRWSLWPASPPTARLLSPSS